nr:uncharacterized protein LOC111516889 [Leptinotarsa decemlineata]
MNLTNMKFFKILLILNGFLLTKGDNTTNVDACTSSYTVLPIVALHADGYPTCTKQPCEVIPGTNLHLDLNFTSPGYLEHIKPVIEATVFNQKVPYDLTQTDACSGILNTMCPLVAGESVFYTVSLQLLPFLPKVSVGLEFSIVNKDTDEAVVCFKMNLLVK